MKNAGVTNLLFQLDFLLVGNLSIINIDISYTLSIYIIRFNLHLPSFLSIVQIGRLNFVYLVMNTFSFCFFCHVKKDNVEPQKENCDMITLNMPAPDISINTHTFSIKHLQTHQTLHTRPQQGEHFVPTSPSYEINYVLRGTTTCWIPNEWVTLNQGDLLLIPPFHLDHTKKQPHFEALQPDLCEQIHINFAAAFIENDLSRSSLPLLEDTKKPSIVHFNLNEQMAIEELFFKILNETNTSEIGRIDMIRVLLIALLIHI